MGTLYVQYEYWVAAFQLVTAMLGMGATLTLLDFREVLLRPKAVTSGSVIQLISVPIVAFFFIQGFGIAGGVAVGIALIAAVPGGTTSNIFTHFARGNTALSVTITALTTIACLVTTPVILGLLIAQYMPDTFVMPRGRIMMEISLTLLLPLAIGMVYLRLFPGSAALFSKWCIRLSLLGILLIVIGSAMSGRLDVDAFGIPNLMMIVGLIFTMALSTWLACRLLGMSSADTTAIDMEVVVRNVNLGFLLKASLFPAVVGTPDPIGDMVLFTLLAYGIMQMLIAAVIIGWRRSRHGIAAKAASQ